MRRMSGQNGFSIVEVVFLIVILSVAIPPLLQLFSENTISAAQSVFLPTANMLGVEMMEQIRSRKFDELDTKSPSNNWSTTLGPDSGESGVKSAFDDVDDFNGWAETFAAPYTGYSATVLVDYVSSSNLNGPLVIPGPVPNGWTPSYKLIRVTVSNAGLAGDITITSLVTEVQSM